MEKKYIMIGASSINRDAFRRVLRPLDNYSFKPTGGFWACEKGDDLINISPWLDYLIEEREIALMKNIKAASIFTLKDSAKILTIDSYDDVVSLSKIYPSYHHLLGYYNLEGDKKISFDYEELADYYDGVYIDYNKLVSSNKTIIFNRFSVNSLLLFNLDCIAYYTPALINIDLESYYVLPYIEKVGYASSISEHTPDYVLLYSKIGELFDELTEEVKADRATNYDEYLDMVTMVARSAINQILSKHPILINKIIKDLNFHNLEFSKRNIVRNMTLDYLSNYLKESRDMIRGLGKTPLTKIKRYVIDD